MCSATYVGPQYEASKPRILFIGLDQGKSTKESDRRFWEAGDRRFTNASDQQKRMLGWYREQRKDWNLHYAGCVRVAAAILGMDCKSGCRKNCSVKPEKACALCQFAQGNAVRCVEAGSKGMSFLSENRIHKCFPFLFEQLEFLRPDVIILQGRRKSGHIHEDFKKELKDGRWGHLEMAEGDIVGTIVWHRLGTYKGPTAIAFFLHPSALGPHMFVRNWSRETLPAAEKIRSILANR